MVKDDQFQLSTGKSNHLGFKLPGATHEKATGGDIYACCHSTLGQRSVGAILRRTYTLQSGCLSPRFVPDLVISRRSTRPLAVYLWIRDLLFTRQFTQHELISATRIPSIRYHCIGVQAGPPHIFIPPRRLYLSRLSLLVPSFFASYVLPFTFHLNIRIPPLTHQMHQKLTPITREWQ